VRRRAPGRERGQATVELALAVPFVVLALLLVVQVALVARAQVLVVHAAREAARSAAVGEPSPPLDGLEPARTDISTTRRGGRVVAVVTYHLRTDLPLVGPLLPDLDLRGSATMRVE
jgi:hypothetical protein